LASQVARVSINPYEPPIIPAEILEPEWPTSGCYRDGRFLVLHHASPLPPICIKTGQPAETEQEYELFGGLPNDGSVPATRKRWLCDKIYAIRIPLTQRAVRRAKLLNVVGITTASMMLLALFSLAWFFPLGRNDLGNYVMISALIGLIVSVGLLSEARQQLQLECVARGFFWISKAPARYLSQLPPWPVPRPSFWRRVFFGPAGVVGPPWVQTQAAASSATSAD
jgi:hypothetical protein